MSEKQFSIKMSNEELDTHEWLKNFFGFDGLYGEDSQTIKQSERMAKMVLLNVIGIEMKEIFQRKSKDDLNRTRKENPPNKQKGNTLESENPPKGNTKPISNDVLGD